MNLYEINSEYNAVMEEVERIAAENEGAIPEDLAARLDAVCGDRVTKIENTIRYIKNTEAMVDAIDAEISRLQQRRGVLDNKSSNLRSYLSSVVGEGNKIELPCGKISWRSSTKTIIVNDFGLPESVYVEKVERKLSLTLVKELIEAGQIKPETAKIVSSKSMQLK